MTFSWDHWAVEMRATQESPLLDDGQRASLAWMRKRLPQSGLVLADEVGSGKTRIACAVVQAVLKANGRAAVVVPHGLMHQWQEEAKKLGMPPAKMFTSLSDFIQEAKDFVEDEQSAAKKWDSIAPKPGEPEWLLISHGFRSPQVRKDKKPAEWRVALPSYVLAQLSPKTKRADRRTLDGKLLADPHEVVKKISEEIVVRLRGIVRNDLKKQLEALPPYRRNGDNSRLVDYLQNGGREVVEKLLGCWLGEFDLIVVDEAHKGRSKIDDPDAKTTGASDSLLSRLIDNILRHPQTGTGRRLCLTATPMELDPSQWLDLFKRARCGLDEAEAKKKIEAFQNATRDAAIAPDEPKRLADLMSASKDFEATLKDFVTRRRRNKDSLIQNFSSCLKLEKGLPHPHRNITPTPISWTDAAKQDSAWFGVLFAAECMSKSALGLSRQDTNGWPQAVRDAYTKLSAGHISCDLFDDSFDIPIPVDGAKGICEQTRGKLARTAYWLQQLREKRKDVLKCLPGVEGAEMNPDAEHPRIIAAVREIEQWTQQQEKVLVFGVFLGPLKLLRDVLNVRHALRAADEGRPIAHAIDTDPALLGIAYRQLDRLRTEGAIKNRLKSATSFKALQGTLRDSYEAYEPLRRRVRKTLKNEVIKWRNDPTLRQGMPQDSTDRKLLDEALEDHLLAFILEHELTAGSTLAKTDDERFAELAQEFGEKRLRPLLGEPSNEDDDKKQAERRGNALQALIEDVDSRKSLHARLLQGETRWETRRYLQAAFNSDYSPQVLIAQSQVGREGLNLHEACRVVVQFHAEWNPAILEQQIGRVDRKGSRWEQLAEEWLRSDPSGRGAAPFIEVRQLLFEGTYDAFQWERVGRRQMNFDASLFGTLVPPDRWVEIGDQGVRERLIAAAPDFSPVSKRGAKAK